MSEVSQAENMSTIKRALMARQLRARPETELLAGEPIAIVGMGCRLPGGADTPEAFWELVRDGVDAISTVPADRWSVDALYDEDTTVPGTVNSRWGGYLDDVVGFDAPFFGISPREAERMDPQQRLVLEVAVEALERAGQPLEELVGSQTGVFMASSTHDYGDQMHGCLEDVTAHSLTGTASCIISNRLSYLFDLRGPSITVDTACSSSLVAVHLACQSLRTRDSDLALAGGANVLLSPLNNVSLSRWGLMSPDGRCKTFDAGANGFVRAEGCGVVVLKRLADAISDNDPVLAVIRGTAVNQDGRSTAMSAPNGLAQQDVVRRALRNAGARPSEISCVEAHGTGTELGDPIEVEALAEVLGESDDDAPTVSLTAVKSNIGHLEGAAGVAGLIKLVLCLQHEQIAPTIHFRRINPHISLDGTRLAIPTEIRPWPAGSEPRLAGVSSFGFGGTNAHVIVEEAPALPGSAGGAGPYALLVSGHTAAARAAAAGRLADRLATSDGDLADVAYTAALRRSHHAERGGVVGATRDELIERLRLLERGDQRPGVVIGRQAVGPRRRVALVFSGQGTQWWAMARDLMSSSATFREIVERCDELLRDHVSWSLIEVLSASEDDSLLDLTEYAQPALFAVQVGLAAVWRDFGVVPYAVAGHSVGEIAAAHVAGAVDLADAIRLVAARGRFMQAATGNGTMASVDRPVDVVESAIAPFGDRLSIAAVNSPRATVIAGETAAMDEVAAILRADGVDVRPLPVDYAFHSAQMTPHADALRGEIADLRGAAAHTRFVSSVDGGEVPGPTLDADYWARNVRRPVRFADAVEALAELGCDVFVEVGPNPVLGGAMAEQLGADRDVVIVPSLRRGRPDLEVMLGTLVQLHCGGVDVDWAAVMPGRRRVEELPTYPWEHQRPWFAAGQLPRSARSADAVGAADHPLLGRRVPSPTLAGALFEAELEPGRPAFLDDHRIGGLVLVPAMGFLEVAAAARAAIEPAVADVSIADFEVHAALALVPDAVTVVRTQIDVTATGSTFRISSSTGGEWTVHASGTYRTDDDPAPLDPPELSAIEERCADPVESSALYDLVARRGSVFGETFRGLVAASVGDDEVLARISAPSTVRDELGRYRFHPALLDATLHAVESLLPDPGAAYLPITIGRYRQFAPPTAELWSHVRLGERSTPELVEIDVSIATDDGRPVAEIAGLTFVRTELDRVAALVERLSQRSRDGELLHRVSWETFDEPSAAEPPDGSWLIVADAGGIAAGIEGALRDRGTDCSIVGPDVDLATGVGTALPPAREVTDVLYARMLDAEPLDADADPVAAQRRGLAGLLEVARALPAARLWCVTRGASDVSRSPVAPEQATVAGFVASLAAEATGPSPVAIDLDPLGDGDQAVKELWQALGTGGAEEHLALRDGITLVPRLVPIGSATRDLDGPARLATSQRGSLDGLHLASFERVAPGEGEIEVRVDVTGLNFRDVLLALGMYPEAVETFGEECCGEVVRVGPGVDAFVPGDRVVAVGSGSLADFLTTRAELAVRLPADMTAADAATIPIAFLTAHYALTHLARLRAGERVLIHAGAGGVGMAAIQLAQHIGADVYATAGSPEKRRRLEQLGVRHIFDSRSLDFADGVLEHTGGDGVDVVLNSLSGEFADRSFAVLASGGRFCEIGRRDIWSAERAAAERPDASYWIIFLGEVTRDDPATIHTMFGELMPLFESGALTPLPVTEFAVGDVVDAFRFMAQARHIGKIVVRNSRDDDVVTPDGTYLVTGGLGGIGLEVAGRLVDLGARHIALTGRSEPGAVASEVIGRLSARGATVRTFRADVADERQVGDLLTAIDDSMPPLRGIVHAAGVTDDALVDDQSWDRVETVLGPKLGGAWNLHRLTSHLDLSMFVVMSAGAAVFGSPGQTNYAAANSFLDSFAAWRRSTVGSATSIAWGPWDSVGMTARLTEHDMSRMTRRGFIPLATSDALDAFERVVVGGAGLPSHVVVAAIDPTRVDDRPLMRLVRSSSADTDAATPDLLLDAWLDTVPAMRRIAIAEFVGREAIKVLGLPPATSIGPRQPFKDLGLDSLMAVELRNAIAAAVGAPQPASLLFDHPTPDSLVTYLLDLVGTDEPTESSAGEASTGDDEESALAARRSDDVERVSELTDEEAEALLLAELDEAE